MNSGASASGRVLRVSLEIAGFLAWLTAVGMSVVVVGFGADLRLSSLFAALAVNAMPFIVLAAVLVAFASRGVRPVIRTVIAVVVSWLAVIAFVTLSSR